VAGPRGSCGGAQRLLEGLQAASDQSGGERRIAGGTVCDFAGGSDRDLRGLGRIADGVVAIRIHLDHAVSVGHAAKPACAGRCDNQLSAIIKAWANLSTGCRKAGARPRGWKSLAQSAADAAQAAGIALPDMTFNQLMDLEEDRGARRDRV
jgi:hypothetical protein